MTKVLAKHVYKTESHPLTQCALVRVCTSAYILDQHQEKHVALYLSYYIKTWLTHPVAALTAYAKKKTGFP